MRNFSSSLSRSRGAMLSPFALSLLLGGCADAPPPEPAVPVPAQTVAAAMPPAPAAVVPAAPSPEEVQKAAAEAKKLEEQKELERDFAEFDVKSAKEKARIAPMAKDITALTMKDYPSIDGALDAVLKSAHRVPGNAERDAQRHPKEMLKFFGFKQNQAVLELDAGAGWYTELLAPLLAKKGKLTVTSADASGPRTEARTLSGMRTKSVLDKSPELGAKATFLGLGKAWDLGPDNTYDTVLALRDLHGWQNRGELDARIAAIFKVLKPGGVFGIEEHRAGSGGDLKTWSEKGYVPEDLVIERCKAAGFELGGKSEINANAKDTKDYAEGVWTLPPSYALGDKDKEKYKAIGESDRMTLKFVKPKAAAAKATAPAKAAAAPGSAPAPAPAKKK
jgi:predicted methyltransferase